MTNDHASIGARVAGDTISLGVVVGTWARWLPSIAALFTIIWTMIRIYETKTVQALIRRWWGH
jgi:chromate transport protein ChrA